MFYLQNLDFPLPALIATKWELSKTTPSPPSSSKNCRDVHVRSTCPRLPKNPASSFNCSPLRNIRFLCEAAPPLQQTWGHSYESKPYTQKAIVAVSFSGLRCAASWVGSSGAPRFLEVIHKVSVASVDLIIVCPTIEVFHLLFGQDALIHPSHLPAKPSAWAQLDRKNELPREELGQTVKHVMNSECFWGLGSWKYCWNQCEWDLGTNLTSGHLAATLGDHRWHNNNPGNCFK